MLAARLKAKMESLSPFLWDSFIPNNMPGYPGALRLADIHVSRKSRENTLLLTRAAEELAKMCKPDYQLGCVPLGHGSCVRRTGAWYMNVKTHRRTRHQVFAIERLPFQFPKRCSF